MSASRATPVALWAHPANEGVSTPGASSRSEPRDGHIFGLVRELESTDAYDPVREPPRPRTPGCCGSPPVERRPEWRTTRLMSSP